MATSGTATVTLPADEQILITREFDAPKHLVYKAYTTPDLVKRWWTGQHGEMTVCEMDFRIGGTWRYVMSPDGSFEIAFHGEYRDIVPNERIVFTEILEMPGAETIPEAMAPVNTVTFAEANGRTTLTILVQTVGKQLRDMILESGMESGMQKQMDTLEEIAISLR